MKQRSAHFNILKISVSVGLMTSLLAPIALVSPWDNAIAQAQGKSSRKAKFRMPPIPNVWSLTATSAPSLGFYSPYASGDRYPVELIIRDNNANGKILAKRSVSMPSKPDVFQVTMPEGLAVCGVVSICQGLMISSHNINNMIEGD
jgi:Domain of Unknown Function (DUF928)